jgi:acetoin utilization protein AcuB
MSKKPITVSPVTTVEVAAQLMLKQRIGGLPVVEKSRLVGVISTSDILQAFLDVMGASEETSTRIDFVLEGEGRGLAEASRIISQEGGEVLSVGTFRKTWGETPVCYLRLRSGNADAIAKVMRERGFEVLGVHAVG